MSKSKTTSLRITDEDFRSFKKHVLEYARILVPELIIYFNHAPLKSAYAQVWRSLEDSAATFTLATECTEKPDFDKVALHEVLHTALWEMSSNLDRFYSLAYVSKIEHELIGKLEKLYFVK